MLGPHGADSCRDWRERSPADLGVTLVEVLAYTADRLCYAQDAVATEAYLATARRRVSVRRHARLVDYRMHDGANARVWVQVSMTDGRRRSPSGPADDRFLTRLTGLPRLRSPTADGPDASTACRAAARWSSSRCDDKTLFVRPQRHAFLRMGRRRVLPAQGRHAGDAAPATSRTLRRATCWCSRSVLGPRTGRAADADPHKRAPYAWCRWPPASKRPADRRRRRRITEIRWAEEDALPFPFCLSARTRRQRRRRRRDRVSATRSATSCSPTTASRSQGRWTSGPCPSRICHVVAGGGDPLRPRRARRPCRRASAPVLTEGPVSPGRRPATRRPRRPRPRCVPALDKVQPADRAGRALRQAAASSDWVARPRPAATAMRRRRALRGRGRSRRPRPPALRRRPQRQAPGVGHRLHTPTTASATAPSATSARTRSRHVVTGLGDIIARAQPAAGAAAASSPRRWTRCARPRPTPTAARSAPSRPRTTPRSRSAIPDVQRAAATFRWNGHGHTVFVTVDRFGGRPVTAEFEAELVGFLDRFRMAGYDLEIDAPQLRLARARALRLRAPELLPLRGRAAVLRGAGDRRLPDGALGFFHPDNLDLRPGRLPERDRRPRAGDRGRRERSRRRVFRRRGQPDPAPLQDGVSCLSAGSRSPSSRTTRTSPSAARSRSRWEAANERLPPSASARLPDVRPRTATPAAAARASTSARPAAAREPPGPDRRSPTAPATTPSFKASRCSRGSPPRPSTCAAPARSTRDDDDFSIALIDAWACACDVLTLLPGAPRQRGLHRHRHRALLDRRARPADRLPPAARASRPRPSSCS